jgi:hypothetical protein
MWGRRSHAPLCLGESLAAGLQHSLHLIALLGPSLAAHECPAVMILYHTMCVLKYAAALGVLTALCG